MPTYQVVETVSPKQKSSHIMVFNSDKEMSSYLKGKRSANQFNTKYSVTAWKLNKSNEGYVNLNKHGYNY